MEPCSEGSGRLNANHPAGRWHRVRVEMGARCAPRLVPRGGGGTRHGHRQFRGATQSAITVPEPLGDPDRWKSSISSRTTVTCSRSSQRAKGGAVFTLDVFGEGPRRKDLERQISSLGLDDQVRLQRISASDVRTLLPGYRAYVQLRTPSRASYGDHRGDGGGPSHRGGDIGLFQSSSMMVSRGGSGLSTIRSRQQQY